MLGLTDAGGMLEELQEPHAGAWPSDAFASFMRTGVVPTGRKVSEWMPIRALRHFDDVELAALHAHLRSLSTASAEVSAPG